jgi:hypothetical protein
VILYHSDVRFLTFFISFFNLLEIVVETLGPKESMKICNLSLKSEDCVSNFESKGDFDTIQSPLDIFLMFVDLEESISKDKRRKLMERIKRIRKCTVYHITPRKDRTQRKREVKLMRRQGKQLI